MKMTTPPNAGPAVVFAKPSLAGFGREGLAAALAGLGVPEKQLRMRVGQLWSWIYARGAPSFEQMSNVSKELRQALAQAHTLTRPELAAEQVSEDGTRKWLLRLEKRGHERRAPEIETVYIPELDRGTLCVSSSGRLHAHVQFLPYRHAAPRAQPGAG